MQSTEKWLPVVGYEGIYEVSDLGRVRGVDRITAKGAFKKGAMKAIQIGKSHGYPVVSLSKGGREKTRTIHTLVLSAFVGPRPDDFEACHNNGIRNDARLSNLRWDTRSANQSDKRTHGTDHNLRRTECASGHKLVEPNLVPSKLKIGVRQCLACSRWRSSIRAGKSGSSNDFYERITSDPTAGSIKGENTCRRGHGFTVANTRWKGNGRECIACAKACRAEREIEKRYALSWEIFKSMPRDN